MSIPVNTMGYHDEELQKWIPIDAVGLKSENNRYTADDIKSLDDIKIDNDNHVYSSAKERIDSDFLKINEKVDQLDKGVDNKITNLEEIINESSSSLNKKIYFKNALSYGADPTGVKPSAEAIQKALDEIHNAGGGQLFIPGGKYLIEKRMFVYENTRVTMAQNCILLRGWAGGFFANGTPTDKFKGYSGRGNIIIEGGILDGNYANINKYPTSAMDSIILGHAKNITIDNVTFKDTISAHAIDANGCDNLRITNSKFTGFIDLTGQRNYSEAIQLGEFIEIGLNQFGEFDGTPNTNVYIAHNYFGKSDLLGGWGCAIGNHYAVYDIFQSNITIFNNVIEDCGFAGVRTFKWNNVKITNNVFMRNKECVRISQAAGGIESSKDADGVQMNRPQNGQNVLIEGNDFYDYTSSGVVAFGQIYNKEIAWNDEIRISGNYFKLKGKEVGKYNDEQAIKLVFARNVFVSNNKIYGGRRGMWVEGCYNTFISGNGISNVDTEAVYLAKSRDTSSTVTKSYHVSIDRNEINTTGRNGIFVQKCDYFDVRDNNVLNNNKEQSSERGRGGIYVENGYDGRIEGNRIRGVEKEFAILVEAEATEVNVANTKGTGRIIVLGESNFNGYYGTNKDDYIRKITTKSES
ncbi:right-handed parallel beta-helix repeat-containing protein [Bacillus haynesii]|uniref:right-handed parallel beta-helix repeat-containing protein n=1 Tax=Bacillus haynesii TaxID=1925021 RepID=UPI002280D1B5|nr:right-handed parallel beta-helix repeat-containing protein [Bacillus haynesii]MCY9290840.1 right-handed parallel beta-helix repeat-containing protein [Bacillus haynesii]